MINSVLAYSQLPRPYRHQENSGFRILWIHRLEQSAICSAWRLQSRQANSRVLGSPCETVRVSHSEQHVDAEVKDTPVYIIDKQSVILELFTSFQA